MKRILITGGSGFFGAAAVRAAREMDAEIHATTFRTPLDDVVDGVIWHRTDLMDPAGTAALLDRVGPTDLVHLAWHLVPGSYDDLQNVRWVRASLDLLDGFERVGGRRAVMVGSGFEYATGFCTEDTTPLRPVTVYGRAKAALSDLVQAWSAGSSVSCAWARVFNAYGPSEDPRRLVASVARALLQGHRAPTSSGDQIRDFLHETDVAEGLLAVLDSGFEGAVNVASGDPVRVRALFEGIADQLDAHDLLDVGAVHTRPTDPPLVAADTRRVAQQVGWRARISLEDGLADCIEHWRDVLLEEGKEIGRGDAQRTEVVDLDAELDLQDEVELTSRRNGTT